MENDHSRFHKAEQMIVRTALIIILLLTLFRIIWSDVLIVKAMIFNDLKTEKSLYQESK